MATDDRTPTDESTLLEVEETPTDPQRPEREGDAPAPGGDATDQPVDDDELEDDELEDGEDEGDVQAPPTVPGFGLLFQAPEPVAPRRRATRQASAPDPWTAAQDTQTADAAPESDLADEDAEASTEADDAPTRSSGRGRGRGGRSGQGRQGGTADGEAPSAEGEPADDSAAPRAQGAEDSDDSDDSDGQPRRRRRRGGRGRNSRTDDQGTSEPDDQDDDTSGPQDSDDGAGASSSRSRGRRGGGRAKDATDSDSGTEGGDGPEGSGDDGDDDSGSGSSRRRRRRRRGAGGGDGQEDPPGTTTRVREPRSARDEVQGVKGSTRLEAKKQRRREGREAGRRRTVITEAEFLARRESVERVMVVRSNAERTQIGVLEDDILVEHYVSRETTSTMVGNVYLGRVQNVLPSMEAAFVDIGKGRNAVLYAGEVNWDAHGVGNGQARRIENALSSGDSVLVQVTKDPIGHKGARLTSQVSLPGRYLVYVPESSMTGISRKLPDKERARLKGILKEVVPDSAGVIVRTAAEGASEEELTKDVERLTKAWERISSKAEPKKGKKSGGGSPQLLHAEPDMTVRVIRDIFNEDFAQMVVQGDSAWREIKGYVDEVAPDLSERLEKFTGEGDVFAAHRIDEQIAKAMDRKVWLPSGGSLVIDRTEAMTVVDVNTGKFVGAGGNLEETVTKNNIEAAEEIVRQLRLRDIGGIIVIDFIDMVLEANRDLVVRRLLECLGRDRTKHQVAEVTSLGLVQMTRKRVGSGLIEVFSTECECCHGRGIHVTSEPVASDPGGHGTGGGGGESRGEGRSRRGKGRGAKGETSSAATEDSRGEPTTDKNGRTPAQIAAAAHAAAIKNVSGEASEDDVADLDLAAEATEPVPATEPAPVVEEAQEPAPAPAATVETVEPAPAPRRRGGRRVASSAGAPVTLQAVDLTASVAPAQSLTTIAGEATPSPEAPVLAPAAAQEQPARKKRKRVVADAGPPKATD